MAGQVVINTLAGFDGPTTSAELITQAQVHADLVRDAWQQHLLPKLSSQYAFVGVTARGVNNPLIMAFSAATLPGGTVPGQPLPTFACAKVKLATATPGRAGRGRTGLCGIVEASTPDNLPNRLASSERGDFETRMNAFRTTLEGGTQGIQLAVVSRRSQGALRPVPLVSFVTSITVDGELGTRVSRLR